MGDGAVAKLLVVQDGANASSRDYYGQSLKASRLLSRSLEIIAWSNEALDLTRRTILNSAV